MPVFYCKACKLALPVFTHIAALDRPTSTVSCKCNYATSTTTTTTTTIIFICQKLIRWTISNIDVMAGCRLCHAGRLCISVVCCYCTLSFHYCTFIMYPAIRLSSRKCAINSVFSVQWRHWHLGLRRY